MRIKAGIAGMVGIAAFAIGAAVATAPEVQAGKPGGGGGTVEGGVIYVLDDFALSDTAVSGVVKAMTPSGTVTAVYDAIDVSAGSRNVEPSRRLEPSRSLHDGRRWFLQERAVNSVREVFAVAQDGAAVRLTDCAAAGATLNILDGTSVANLRWVGPDDAAVSFGAYRIVGGVMEDCGIHRMAVNWGAIAGGTWAPVQPTAPWLAVPPHRPDLYKVNTNFVWSPDGGRAAWVLLEVVGTPGNLSQRFSLHLAADDGSGTGVDESSTPLTGSWILDDWGTSNGDDVLAYRADANASTLNLRTGAVTTIALTSFGSPYPQKTMYNLCWSPAGGFLVYDWAVFSQDRKTGGIKGTWNVLRMPASGVGTATATDLTGFGTNTRVLGWR